MQSVMVRKKTSITNVPGLVRRPGMVVIMLCKGDVEDCDPIGYVFRVTSTEECRE